MRTCSWWRKEVGRIFSGCWGRNLEGIWQHLLMSPKLCLRARRKLGADLGADVWDGACAGSVKTHPLGFRSMKGWGAEMYWSSRAGKCLGMSSHTMQEPTDPKGGSNRSRQSDQWQQPAKRTKIPIHVLIASRNKSHWGEGGQWHLFFLCWKSWAAKSKAPVGWKKQCSGKDNFMWKLSRQCRMSSMFWD